MTREELGGIVIDAVRETLRLSGRNDVLAIDEATVPIGDLDDFDSHNGIEATLMLEEQVEVTMPDKLFIDTESGRALCIAEIVDRILDLLASQEER